MRSSWISDRGSAINLDRRSPSRRPTARRLILRAADKYASRRAPARSSRTSALLSKPWASVSSAGRSARPSMSSANRSRMALVYSVRFRRWTARPARIRRRLRGSVERTFERRHEGCRRCAVRARPPTGGICPARIFRTTFSQVSAFGPTAPGSIVVQLEPGDAKPAVVARHAVAIRAARDRVRRSRRRTLKRAAAAPSRRARRRRSRAPGRPGRRACGRLSRQACAGPRTCKDGPPV